MLTLKKTSVFVVAFVHSSSAFVIKNEIPRICCWKSLQGIKSKSRAWNWLQGSKKRRFKNISENSIFLYILTLTRHYIKYLEKYIKLNLFLIARLLDKEIFFLKKKIDEKQRKCSTYEYFKQVHNLFLDCLARNSRKSIFFKYFKAFKSR